MVCFVAAVGLHFGWDWIVLSYPEAMELGSVLMLLGFFLYGTLVTIASRRSHALFAAGMPPRLWGWPFTKVR
jgi:hypothetical protein